MPSTESTEATTTKSTTTTTSSSYEQDKKTQAQIEAIEQEIKSQQSLTSNRQPLSNLVNIYKKGNNDCSNGGGNQNFILGSEYLCQKYTSWRMIRGDGNCYYRAFLYAVCEELVMRGLGSGGGNNVDKELQRLQQYVQSSIDEVTKYGYDRFTIETFHEELVELFDFIASNTDTDTNNNISIEEVQSKLHSKLTEENSTSDYCTWYLRVITSSHLKCDPNRFIHYLDDPNYFDVETFCSREVDPMGKECGMVQVLALAEAMGVKVNIEYLDGRDMVPVAPNTGAQETNEKKLMLHQFGPDVEDKKNEGLEITLLYRPGHYDILYV